MTGAVHKTETLAIIQLARFGDLVQTSALVQNLKREEGYNREITLFVDERNVQIASMLSCVDKVISIPLRTLPSHISKSIYSSLENFKIWLMSWYDGVKYDSLILLNQGIIPGSIGHLIKSTQKSGPFDIKNLPRPHHYLNKALVDRSYNPVNLYEIWSAYGPGTFPLPKPALKKTILGTPFAFTSIDVKLRACKNNNIAFNLGAGAAGRTPSKEKLAVLMNLILENGNKNVVLLGTQNDTEAADYMLESISSTDKSRVYDFTGKTTIQQLVSLLHHVELLVSADTGTVQLAAAVGTKILGLFFGGANPYETGPYTEKSAVLVHKDTLDQDENSDGKSALEELNMRKVHTLINIMIANKSDLKEIEDEFDPFILYLARPTSMGVEYRSLREENHLPLGKARRWLPEIRSRIWGEKYNAIQSSRKIETRESIRVGIEKISDPHLKVWLSHLL